MLERGCIWIERYKIIREIGMGGMGCVYLAEGVNDHSVYAIKEQTVEGKMLELVLSEVAIQKKLRHPALPKIFETCESNGYFYIVMEYIEGVTLDTLIQEKGSFGEVYVLDWAKQLTDILIYLHNLDEPIVYRDLKPSNIMLDTKGRIHLIDFGIAQEYRDIKKQEKKIFALTRGYAAPEQYDRRYRADVRTDIYSLGVSLHYLLTGKNPTKPPYHFQPVRKLKMNASYAIEAIIKRCLQPNPDDRYKKAEALKEDLDNIKDIERKLQIKRKRRNGLVLGTSVAVILVLLLLFVIVKQKRSSDIEAYYTLLRDAQDHVKREEYAGALEILNKVIEMQPEAEEGYLAIADLYMEQGRYDECFSYINSELMTRFHDLYNNVSFLSLMGQLYLKQDKPADAEYYFARLYENDPDNMDYLYGLTYCRIKMGKTEEVQEGIRILRKNASDESMVDELEQLLLK